MSTSTPDLEKKMYTIAVSGGNGGVEIRDDYDKHMAREMLQIIIVPPVSTATYRIYIREVVDDVEIYRREDEIIGDTNELFTTALPLCGRHELYITNASVDGNYKARIVFR